MSMIINKIGSRSGRIWAGQPRAEVSGGGGGASTFTAVADGAIAAGDECSVTSAGKLQKVAESTGTAVFGPSTTGLYAPWSPSYGWRFQQMCDVLWSYAQTLGASNPFATLDALRQAAFTSFTNSSWGIYVHMDNIGNYGHVGQYSFSAGSTSDTYNSYYVNFGSTINTISAAGSAPNSTYTPAILNWMSYKQLVFRFTHVVASSNMTAHNLVGWSTGAYADGANATVSLKGTIETNLNGLTTGSIYYVQLDGTVGTTAADPSVLAGVALASNKLLVS